VVGGCGTGERWGAWWLGPGIETSRECYQGREPVVSGTKWLDGWEGYGVLRTLRVFRWEKGKKGCGCRRVVVKRGSETLGRCDRGCGGAGGGVGVPLGLRMGGGTSAMWCLGVVGHMWVFVVDLGEE